MNNTEPMGRDEVVKVLRAQLGLLNTLYRRSDAAGKELVAEVDGNIREAIAALQAQPVAPAAAKPDAVAPDPKLCEFYEVTTWPELVAAQEAHVLQLQDAARRNVKPWEDTFPPTLLPKYLRETGLAAAEPEVRTVVVHASTAQPDAVAGHKETRADQLAEVLKEAEEYIDAKSPSWYGPGQRLLKKIRDTLRDQVEGHE